MNVDSCDRRASLSMVRVASLAVALVIAWPASEASAQGAASVFLTGAVAEYVVRQGDTLASVSARLGVGVDVLCDLNHLDRRSKLVPGQTLTIDTRHLAVIDPQARITINIAQRMLYLADDDALAAFPVAVGIRGWPTPVGAFTVVDKEENPAWDVPVSIQEEMRRQGKPVILRMPPSPANPLGSHWIRLSFTSIGLHGTIAPNSIYHYASHGCVRLHPVDIAAVFARVTVGDAGVMQYQPVVMGVSSGRIFLEAHPDTYRRGPNPMHSAQGQAARLGVDADVDWSVAATVLRETRGLAVDVTRVR